MLNRYLTLLFICCLSTACSVINPTVQHTCEEPRPEVCTREYVPVCAIKSDNSEGLYANGCSACSNIEVVGYNEGACPQP
jgi:hypothetical protein